MSTVTAPQPARSRPPHLAARIDSVVQEALDLRLLEALREGRARLLPAELIAELGRDQTGGRTLPDSPGFGFGLGFSVLRDQQLAMSPESAGTWRWGGVYGHSWLVDRTRGLSVVAFTNTLYEGMSGQFVPDLRDAVYAGLEGAR